MTPQQRAILNLYLSGQMTRQEAVDALSSLGLNVFAAAGFLDENTPGIGINQNNNPDPAFTPDNNDPFVAPGGRVPAFDPTVRPNTLEDRVGIETAQRAQLSSFIDDRFGDVAGGFRNFLSNQGGRLRSAFDVNELINPFAATDFNDFLERQGGATSAGFGAGITEEQLNRAADVLRGGSGAPGLTDTQRGAVDRFTNQPLSQFDLALAPRLQQLPAHLRGNFANVARRRFNQILATRGTDPGFEFLPDLQDRNFRLFQGK